MSLAPLQPHCPSPAVAHAVAAISVLLPGAPENARHRLAAVVAECDTHNWSDATRAALARRETAWLAVARRLGRSIRDLQRMDAVCLLGLLRAAELCTDRNYPSAAAPPDDAIVVEDTERG